MSAYIDVKIDVFEQADQRARVLESLTPAGLILEVLKEFDDITSDAPEKYAIYLKGMERPLNPDSTMTQLDIQPQDILVFDYVRKTIREMLDPKDYAILREETTGKVYDIQWQPAVIGRPDADDGHNIILAVNLKLLPNGMTVSRKHAQITFSEDHYFIEPLAEHNPVVLNGKEIPLNSKREIKNNDKLTFGRAKISMVFETHRMEASAASKAKPQPVKIVPPSPQPVPSGKEVNTPADSYATFLAPGENPASFLIIEKCSIPENVGQKLTIIAYPFLLGRAIPLLGDGKDISRNHAEITYDPRNNKFYVTDLNSTNGVTIDGVRIRPAELTEIKPGSKLGLGTLLVLRFVV